MSGLRERCFSLWDKMPNTTKCYCSDIDFNNWPSDVRKACTVCRRVDDIEAFARAEQIKGMEAVSAKIKAVAFLYGNDRWRERLALTEIADAIDDEIAKLKGGG